MNEVLQFPVFKHGIPVASTVLHPTVRKIMRRDGIKVVLNDRATEPRWEAYCATARSFAGDPNAAVLDCAWERRCATT